MDKIFPDGYRVTDSHIFFWTSFLSNFKRTKFTFSYMDEEHEFFCTEQAFMWVKAKFFGDDEVANKILVQTEPKRCQELGREVKNYDDAKWAGARYDVMLQVNLAKYMQDKTLRDRFLDPIFDGKTFVEASPYDGIWGIKMGLGAEGVDDERNWNGQNLLGQALTSARATLKAMYSDSVYKTTALQAEPKEV